MRLALVFAIVVAATGTVAADGKPTSPTPKPINLARVWGTWIGVSSQVTSTDFELESLVDHDPATAWNSASGDLVGAWIDVHTNETVLVTSILMTVGFTKVDTDRDLFTSNVRIKKVRVTRDGNLVYDKVLDVNNRGLQELPINARGVIRIEVLEVVHGTNPTWNETCVSELEAWGISQTPSRQDALPVTVGTTPPPRRRVNLVGDETACATALDDDKTRKQLPAQLVAIEGEALDGGERACNAELAAGDDAVEHTHVVYLIDAMSPTAPIGKPITFTTRHKPGAATIDGDVEIRAVPLGPHETAVLVDHTHRLDGGGMADGATASTVYRATKTGFVEVLRFDSKWTSKPNVVDLCEVELGERRQPFADLDIACKRIEKPRPPSDPDAELREHWKVTERVEHFRWNGSKYAKR